MKDEEENSNEEETNDEINESESEEKVGEGFDDIVSTGNHFYENHHCFRPGSSDSNPKQ